MTDSAKTVTLICQIIQQFGDDNNDSTDDAEEIVSNGNMELESHSLPCIVLYCL